jgi:hypothetical protein
MGRPAWRVAEVAAMTGELRIVTEWTDAPGVESRDLAATWCRLSVWIGGDCTTVVRDAANRLRDGVDGSAYPLAEWIAYNWWPLTMSQRPSALETARWSWRLIPQEEWLRHHNVRSANEGHSWPDLTLVREGGVFCAAWLADPADNPGAVRFLTSGKAFLAASDVIEALRAFVEAVLARLTDLGVDETSLSKEWRRVRSSEADPDEAAFCAAAARLGLDPFDVPESVAEALPGVAEALDGDLLGDFLDSADPEHLSGAMAWLRGAQAGLPANRNTISELRTALRDIDPADSQQPWATGYQAARALRDWLGTEPTHPVDPSAWVAVGQRQAEPHGLRGYGATTSADSCSVLVPGPLGTPAKRFAAARALGRALFQPTGTAFLLTPTATPHQQRARAFAAELLAPASGIQQMLEALGDDSDGAYEAVAKRYGVRPLLVRHQVVNQLP